MCVYIYIYAERERERWPQAAEGLEDVRLPHSEVLHL